MATVTKGSSYYYQDSKGGVSQVVGYESKTRRVCRTAFTVDSPCTDLTVKLYASLGNVEYRNCQIYMAVSESDTAYVGHTGTDGTFLGSWNASGTKTATITNLILLPNVTYYLWFYHYADSYAWLYVTNGNITLTASGTPYTTFDVNGLLDGTSVNNISGYGTCDVYINGSLASNDCSDYYSSTILMNSTYEVKDIKATTGHTYKGVDSGSTSGTLGINGASLRLSFNTNYVSRLYHPNQGIVTNTSYTQNEYGWIMSGGTYRFDNLYYGNSHDCYDASTFGLIRPGYSFSGWLLDSNAGNPPYSGVYKIFDETTAYASTEFHKMGDPNTTTATVGVDNFTSYLSAQWTPNNYTITFDASGGSAVSARTVAYSNGSYSLPTTTYTGRKFKRWYADIGANGPINLGRDYMYTNGIDIYLEAYMDDWTQFGDMRLISCTESGGWNIEPDGGYIKFTMYDAGVGYKYVKSTTKWADLTPGWHLFRMIFSSGYMAGYIDHAYQGQVALTAIGYNATNSIFIGGEATSSNTASSGGQFTGYIGNVSITNGGVNPPTNNFPIPIQNITLYAEWEPCDWMYIKVNGAWKLGRVLYKEGGEWNYPSGVESPYLPFTVTKPSSASYGFAKNNNGLWESQNKGVASSAAVGIVNFTLTKTTTVVVECINSGEANFDFGIISNLGASLGTTSTVDTTSVKHSFKGSSSTSIQTISFGALAAGTYSFYIKFRKDGSVNSGNDSLQFTLVKG